MSTDIKPVCEYADCFAEATVYDEYYEVDLCEKHSNNIENQTGYCSRSCIFGYGCDESC